MKENDEIRMTNAESITNSERGDLLSRDARDLPNIGCAKVERVVPWHAVTMRRRLNALQKTTALPPDNCAFGDQIAIVFREADPPGARYRYLLTKADAITLVRRRFRLRHLVIPSSLDIRLPRRSTAEAGHSSFSRDMCTPRRMVA